MKTQLIEGYNPQTENETDIEKEVTTEQLKQMIRSESPEEIAYQIISEYNESRKTLHKENYPDNPSGYLDAVRFEAAHEQAYSDWLLEFNEKYPEELERAIFRSIKDLPMTGERQESTARTMATIHRLIPCFPEYDAEFAEEYMKGMNERWKGVDLAGFFVTDSAVTVE